MSAQTASLSSKVAFNEPSPFPYPVPVQSSDEYFMLEALKEAWQAYLTGEVPVGAVIVYRNQIIARGYNQVEERCDATAHAEMLCMHKASQFLNNWRLSGASLYCTLEPCSMCAGAMLLARLDRVYWGCPDIRHGANGSWVDLFAPKHPMHSIIIAGGLLSEYAAALLRSFFQERRQKKGHTEPRH